MATLKKIILYCLTITATTSFCFENALLQDPYHSPFAYMTDYIKKNDTNIQGYPEFYFNEGYLNFTQDWAVNPNASITNANTNYLLKNAVSKSYDITRALFSEINEIKNANTHIVAFSVDKPSAFNEFKSISPSQIHISKKLYKTHGKNMQASNGLVWFSQNGSLNLQTVGETCKANNSIVFVETSPKLYNHFKGLWNSVYKNGADKEHFLDGTHNSSGLQSSNWIEIGDRNVSFYAGRNDSFVGASLNLAVFPNNLYPPLVDELPKKFDGSPDLSNVDWYDQIIFDAGSLLIENKTVNVDIVIFEIGKSNQFINNLYRFVQNGFEKCVRISKIPNAPKPTSIFPGKLNVNLYYQFQVPNDGKTQTAKLLNGENIINENYRLNAIKVWQNFANMGQYRPKTPQDMHHKFAIVTYDDGAKHDYKLYVTTSNLDEPKVGSGKKWQAGTVITSNGANDLLFRFYANKIKNVLQGQQSSALSNVDNSYFDESVKPSKTITKSGIAAFAFPLLPENK